mmetsp:Transcript_29709/g.72370  ORF Transcript_29709/g.72370 Transcript_29709/m.72370 type:complete len:502 (-) Transcript_29709:68-1573(-)
MEIDLKRAAELIEAYRRKTIVGNPSSPFEPTDRVSKVAPTKLDEKRHHTPVTKQQKIEDRRVFPKIVQVHGIVSRIRPIGRYLGCMDLYPIIRSETKLHDVNHASLRLESELITLMVAADDIDDLEVFRDIKHQVHIGDIVQVFGYLLFPLKYDRFPNPEIQVKQIKVISAWNTKQMGNFSLAFIRGRHEEEKEVRDILVKESQQSEKSRSLCKRFINSGKCGKPNCTYRHFLTKGESRGLIQYAWKQSRLEIRQQKPSTDGDSIPGSDKRKHSRRAQVFCEWLKKTFGDRLLQQGVLDVAGGRGDVAVELLLLGGFNNCTVIDPRPVKLSKRQRRRLEERKTELLSQKESNEDITPLKLAPQKQELFGEKFIRDQANQELLKNAGLFVGMHPDQATEPIVDWALKLNKPFAVIPCCVFGYEHRDRKLRNGNPVYSYEDYVNYLQEKDPAIQRTFLPFHGKNQVLYKLPATQTMNTKPSPSTDASQFFAVPCEEKSGEMLT